MPPMIRAALVSVSLASNAAAEPVTLRCDIKGATAALWGTLIVTFDQDAHHVHIESLRRLGATFDYWNGAVASVYTGRAPFWLEAWEVEQFVRVTPARVELGFRSVTGELVHLAWFNRSALQKNGTACHWHSLWDFDVG